MPENSPQLDTIAAAVEAERTRCIELSAMSMSGFEAVITEAIKTGATVEATAHKIMLTMRGRGVSLQQIAADSTCVPFAPAATPEPRSPWGAVASRIKREMDDDGRKR